MNRTLLILAFMLVLCHSGIAQGQSLLDVKASLGITSETFAWSIAGNIQGKNPNVLSELVWSDLQTYTSGATATARIWRRFHGQASFHHGFIVSGHATDTDYEEDNRQIPSFHAAVQSNKGHVQQWQAGIRYNVVQAHNFSLSPIAGYGLNRQQLSLTDDDDLNSTYTARWKGFNFGLASCYYISPRVFTAAQLTYHQVTYTADANWNLIEIFQHPVSFTHDAKGFGTSANLSIGFKLNPRLNLSLDSHYQYWSTGAGIDTVYLTDGTTRQTRMNDATRKAFGINASIMFSILSKDQ